MMTRLRALFQRNLPAKIIALVVAVVLWLFVMNEQNPQDTRSRRRKKA